MNSDERYLVYGASGVQGGALARLLTGKGLKVRTITRNEQTAVNLNNQGIEALVGDLADVDFLDLVHEGVQKVFLSLPVNFDLTQVRTYILNAVDAARRANIQLLVVNTNVYVPEYATEAAAIEIKRELAEYVRLSGVPFVIVQPILYMENFLIPGLLQNGVLAYPVPAEKPIAWISADDAAKYHFYALTHPELAGGMLQAPGPEALTGQQIAERFSDVVGEQISFYSLPVEHFEAGISSMLGAETASGLAGLYRWINENTASLPQPGQTAPEIQSDLRMTTLAQWLKEAIAQGRITV